MNTFKINLKSKIACKFREKKCLNEFECTADSFIQLSFGCRFQLDQYLEYKLLISNILLIYIVQIPYLH